MSATGAATEASLQSLESWDDFYYCISQYGAQIAIVTCLSAVTVFRREMSCNRVFHEEPRPVECNSKRARSLPSRTRTSAYTDEKECEREEVLDGAGLYYAAAPLLAAAQAWLEGKLSLETEPVCSPGRHFYTKSNAWKKHSRADLLDRVGNNYSDEPFWKVVAFFLTSMSYSREKRQGSRELKVECPFSRNLPGDVHVQIASYLHPRDAVTLACVSKSYRTIIDRSETSAILWKTLWHRDFGWLLRRWDIGQQAFRRSKTSPTFNKRFYFLFGQSYLDYVLAGQNTSDRCLVGLDSNIYDVTPFLHLHPGSPDTLMVHAGKDATAFFEDMGHSTGARRMAKSLCVVVNCSNDDDICGVHPTVNTKLVEESQYDTSTMPPTVDDDRLTKGRRGQRKKWRGTLVHIRDAFQKEQEQVKKRIDNLYSGNSAVLGEVNIFYDPIHQAWQGWYTNAALQTIFMGDI